MLRPCFIAALAFVAPTTGAAQPRDTTMIPRQLALALIGMIGPYEGSSLTVGQAPTGFPREVLPSNLKILGGAIFRYRRPSSAGPITVIATSAQPPDSTAASLRSALERAGWRAAPSMARPMGGFVDPMRDMRRDEVFCRDSVSVSTSTAPGEESASLVRFTFTPAPDARVGACNPDRERMMTARRAEPIQLPTLRPPVGVRFISRGMSSGQNSRESVAEIETDMSAADLVTHFAAQLRNEGWTLSSRFGDAEIAVLTARKSDAEGRELRGILLATSYAEPRSRTVSFRAIMPTRR
jgi:hypothetical protein